MDMKSKLGSARTKRQFSIVTFWWIYAAIWYMLKCGYLKEENMKKKIPQSGSSAVWNLIWWPSQGKHGVVYSSSQGCQQTQHSCQRVIVFHGSNPPSWCDIVWSTRLLALTVKVALDTIVWSTAVHLNDPTHKTVHPAFETLGHFEVWIEARVFGWWGERLPTLSKYLEYL
jgi:hypothetical protein